VAADNRLERLLIRSITATCEALFPSNTLGAPDWQTTEMVPRMLEYLQELPVRQRRLLKALFILVEVSAALLVFGFRRFSKLSPERRAAAVRRWRRSRFIPLRIIGDALKATTTVIYMSHPRALAYVGAYTPCTRPADPLELRVDASALMRVRAE
jgi:hypothetical protein